MSLRSARSTKSSFFCRKRIRVAFPKRDLTSSRKKTILKPVKRKRIHIRRKRIYTIRNRTAKKAKGHNIIIGTNQSTNLSTKQSTNLSTKQSTNQRNRLPSNQKQDTTSLNKETETTTSPKSTVLR